MAAAAWLVAAEVAPGASRPAFWLAATGPVVVNAYVVWAHAPSAAAAGFTVLSALRIGRSERLPLGPVVLLAVSVVAGVLLRSEGLLLVLAAAAGLAWTAVRVSDPQRRRALLAVAVLAGGLGMATAGLERRWTSDIIGREFASRGVRDSVAPGGPLRRLADLVAGRAEGVWHSVLEGAYNHPTATVVVTAALVLSGFLVWSARRRAPGWERDVAGAIAVAAGLYLVRLFLAPDQAITGLAAAWPVAVVGLGCLTRPSLVAGRPLVVVGALFALGVAASQYRFGGGLEWGGRFFSPLLVPMAVLAAMGLGDLVARAGPRNRLVLPALVSLALTPALAGLVMLRTNRPLVDAVVAEVATAGPGLVLTDSPVLPRAAWRTYPGTGWMLVPPGELVEVADRLRAGGTGDVVVVAALGGPGDVQAAFPEARDVTGPGAAHLGWRMFSIAGSPTR